jgi:hypothetical protein
MSTMLLGALLAFCPAGLQAGKDRKDQVTPFQGAVIEGEIQRDTWKEVVIKVGGATQTIPANNVKKVDYWDAPPAFKGAMGSFEQEKWAEVLSALSSAEEYANSKEKGILKPRPWFGPYLAWYRGKCMMEVGRSDDALRQFEKIRKEFKDSRFLAQAYESSLEAFREKGDVAKMDEFEKEIEQAPGELKLNLQVRARRQRAELLYDKAKYEEARKLFETITTAADPEIAAAGTAGVIRSLSGLKDLAGLETYANKVLATSKQPALQLLASNALGEGAFEAKKFDAARDRFIQSVVHFNPGRGTGIEREHEKALYRLALCYENLMAAAGAPEHKQALAGMAASTYRELSIEYPSGKYREEASLKAAKLESSAEKKDEKK